MSWNNIRQNSEAHMRPAPKPKSSAKRDFATEFRERVELVLKHRWRWRGSKEIARSELARDLKVTPRVIERWERGEFKHPQLEWWFEIEEMWMAIKDLYDTTCDKLEDSARSNNSEE
jgi:ribosome-binding protein aMBF1 (putative translation factor)